MEALQIISQSWPIAAIAVVFFASIGIYAIVHRFTAAENDRVFRDRVEEKVRNELRHIEQMKQIG